MQIKAMVVDDSGIMRKMVMRGLKEAELAEFTFVEAKDGLDALEKFDSSIDMMFVDWNMPNMNGLDFIKKVRETAGDSVVAVMITTESSMGKVEEALEEANVDSFVVKPFTADVLKTKLAPVFEKMTSQKKSGFFGRLAASLD